MSVPRRHFVNIPCGEPRLEKGAALFNRHAYFEAHEVWESLWHDVDGEERQLLQGLIQLAAALYHLTRGNRPGAEELYLKGRARVACWAPQYVGLLLGDFLEAVDAHFNAIARGEVPSSSPMLMRQA